MKELEKFDTFTNFLDVHQPELAIVFGRTKRRVDELTSALLSKGYKAEGLHGDITQAKRLEVLKKFKNDQIDILVATDVAARGLDISGVSHVYNFDIIKILKAIHIESDVQEELVKKASLLHL